MFATLRTIAARGWKDIQTDIGYMGYRNIPECRMALLQVRSGQVESVTEGTAEGAAKEKED